ncbi:virulence factor Mce family protein [Streptomyces albus]|uniref:Virulence factor Mce family protein n=1 Tax=Streptomyces albus (strain ATCC 21838 / DSM 41398 / FERM P-419 / JCM 4703 / NBRC 107858) TaxID=1081613 RepID=A0A0B5ESW4_STRA4|nr:virulence factor Mce family protein [Streptomyces albus]AOU80181.1 virulence factor Mce family protein [Streptomyces albus]AYN35897.1 MCE-family lipoprotein LprK (MCE-family lipoprotein Mce1e) [Streptomyces albus]
MKPGLKRLRLVSAPAAALLALALGFTLAVGGCSATGGLGFDGIEDLPLPGGADLGDHPYEITAEIADVLSLVPQSAVKVNDVAVGRVTRIDLAENSWTARVRMRINGTVRLPAGSGARVEQSSLLGEKYVQLLAPGGKKSGTAGPTPAALRPGAVIPLSRTGRNTEVEEVFGALSLLLNGGGVNQLRTITTELNKALGGREPEIRSLLRRVDTLVTGLDENRGAITGALDGVNKLSARLATRKEAVGKVLTDLSPGLKTLEKQRGALMTMLRSLDTLSTVATDTVDRSKDDMVADLKALAPVLGRLADSGKDLPDSLQVLLTYPFTDEVLRGVKGDYLNIYLDMTAVPGTTVIPPVLGPSPTPSAGARGPGARPPATGERRRPTGTPLPLPSVPAPSASAPTASGTPAASPGGTR